MRDGDFRIRGKEISRVEGLSDAVFGFAITLLAVSLEVPKTAGEVLHALRGVPAFAITFLILFNMWRIQFNYFRRYGIEDRRIVWLTAALLFVLLVFIYPLKFVMATICESMLKHVGLPDPTFHRQLVLPDADISPLFTAFGFGLSAVFGVFSLMFRHALSLREQLQLDDLEVFDTAESLRATTKTAVLGGCMGVCYLIGTIRPDVADVMADIATGLVIVVGLWIVRQRRGRAKRRAAVQGRVAEVAA
jgi:hypothetical protein